MEGNSRDSYGDQTTMDERSGNGRCYDEVNSMPDTAKAMDMAMTGAGQFGYFFYKGQGSVKNKFKVVSICTWQ